MNLTQAQFQSIVRSILVLSVLAAPVWLYALLFMGDYDIASPILWVPVVLLANVAGIHVLARKDAVIRLALPTAFLFKFAMAGMNSMFALGLYGGGDAPQYFIVGKRMAQSFAITGVFGAQAPYWGTDALNVISAVLTMILGPSMQLQVVIFAALSFWGHYLMYRAVCIAIPNVNRYFCALLMLFFPSVVFWSATLGKDSLMILFVAMVVYGFARLSCGDTKSVYGYIAIFAGMAGGVMVRPHVIGVAAFSIAVPYIFSRNRTGAFGAALKLVGIPLIIWGSIVFFRDAVDMLDLENVSQGVQLIDRASASSGAAGGSVFAASMTVRLLQGPFFIFRPFVWEVRNAPGIVAALEGLALLVLFFGQYRRMFALLKQWRDMPLVTFAFLYSMSLSFIFSSAMSNLGVIARQRAVLLPLAMIVVLGTTTVSREPVARRVAVRPMRRVQRAGVV